MNFVIGVLLLWIGSSLLWVASHNLDASSPWGVYTKIIDGLSAGSGG